jgi:hypothetical protein
MLPLAVSAYQRIGMQSEADALQAALAACRRGGDDDALEAAYKSVPNRYIDEDVRNDALLAFFSSHRHLFDA